jgi:hypothetical protein
MTILFGTICSESTVCIEDVDKGSSVFASKEKQRHFTGRRCLNGSQ